MQGGEVLAAHEWLRREIKKIAALEAQLRAARGNDWDAGIRPLPFPEGAPIPGIGFSLISGRDFTTIGENRLFSDMLWSIVAVTKEDRPALAGYLALLVDQYLNEQENTDQAPTSYGSVIECHRESPIYMPLAGDEGSTIWHIGGLYRMKAR